MMWRWLTFLFRRRKQRLVPFQSVYPLATCDFWTWKRLWEEGIIKGSPRKPLWEVPYR